MDDPQFSEERNASATKTIRLTRSEIYAMRLATPRKKRMAFGLVGLLVAGALGGVLWFFQDAWLPFWFPPAETGTPETEPVSVTEPVPPPGAPSAPANVTAVEPEPEATLDFLSATPWDDPRFLQGVRLFNQALDRYRRFLNDSSQAPLLPQIETGAGEALRAFESLRPDAPPTVPLPAYAARCRRLLEELERLRVPARPAPPPPDSPSPEFSPESFRRQPAFAEAARLFNQAIERFKLYKANTARKDLLPQTEELARQAAERFETLKKEAPAGSLKELDRYIHQSYGLVSACRGEQLKDGSPAPAPNRRDPANARRRPALPAYQPSP